MKKQFTILFVLLAIASGTVLSQSSIQSKGSITLVSTEETDTTIYFSLPVWQIDRMINEVIQGRIEHNLCVKTNLENRLLKRQNNFYDSAYAEKAKQVSELQDANKDNEDALGTAKETIKIQAKEIRKQKRLKWIFLAGGVLIAILI